MSPRAELRALRRITNRRRRALAALALIHRRLTTGAAR